MNAEPSFLQRMAQASRDRVRDARARLSEAVLRQLIDALPLPPPLTLDRFDVIAELKLRSPVTGELATPEFDRNEQLAAYAAGGAAAVSVLTEPVEFKGELAHLADAAVVLAAQNRPVMRKDFITDPYQVLEARAAGAGGVLVIVTMLDDATVRELVDCALGCSMFVLLEGFDGVDLERISAFDEPRSEPSILAGVNCRDLRDLNVRFERFAELAPYLPRHLPAVAESGIATVDDIRTVAQLGYGLALIGSSLMTAAAPSAALGEFIAAGRIAVDT